MKSANVMEYDKERDKWAELNSRQYPRRFGHTYSFNAGYNGAIKNSPVIKRLESALSMYAMTNETFPEYGDAAREALAYLNEIRESVK